MNQIREWNLGNFRHWITDTSSPQFTGTSGLYSLQNGLLLKADIHIVWDSWGIAVDPDVSSSPFHKMCMHHKDANVYIARLPHNLLR